MPPVEADYQDMQTPVSDQNTGRSRTGSSSMAILNRPMWWNSRPSWKRLNGSHNKPTGRSPVGISL